MALGRRGPRQTRSERAEFRRHLDELEGRREERLRDLGGLAVEMYKRDRFRAELLWAQAAEVAGIDDEARLVRRGIDERLTREQLEELGRADPPLEVDRDGVEDPLPPGP